MCPITPQILQEGGKQHCHHPMDHRAWSKGQERRHHSHGDTATVPRATCRVSGKKDEIIAVLESPTGREIPILALLSWLGVAEQGDGPGGMVPACWLLGFAGETHLCK